MSHDDYTETCDVPPADRMADPIIDAEFDSRPAPKQSRVLDLLDIVWKYTGDATRHSWDRVNHSMHQALCLAIGSGMKFGPDDFEEIQRRYRFHYWGGADAGGFAEGFYTLAVVEGNASAAQAFEKWKGRKPFIVDSALLPREGRYTKSGGRREMTRLTVRAEFAWRGQRVKVTSFAEDGSHLVACSYQKDPTEDKPCERCGHTEWHYWREKIDRRYKITAADLRQARQASREAEAAAQAKAEADTTSNN